MEWERGEEGSASFCWNFIELPLPVQKLDLGVPALCKHLVETTVKLINFIDISFTSFDVFGGFRQITVGGALRKIIRKITVTVHLHYVIRHVFAMNYFFVRTNFECKNSYNLHTLISTELHFSSILSSSTSTCVCGRIQREKSVERRRGQKKVVILFIVWDYCFSCLKGLAFRIRMTNCVSNESTKY